MLSIWNTLQEFEHRVMYTPELPTMLSFFLVFAATNGLSAIHPIVNHDGAFTIKMASERSG